MPDIKWDAKLYDDKHSFVSKYGEDLIGWLHPQNEERVLDLGCGTGQLTNEINNYGAEVTGIDNSPEMVAKAKAGYPGITFEVMDATNFSYEKKFDAVFSNAVLHWITEPAKVIACVYDVLQHGGRFVLEMGGKHNVQNISNALKIAMIDEGVTDKITNDFWYFPSVSEYTGLLEKQGFTVKQVLYFERETALVGEDGMADWIKMFGSFFFRLLSPDQAQRIIEKTVAELRSTNYRDGIWYADYVRLRVKAVK